MSLLMEALRKAEEAKSKAAKEEKDSDPGAEATPDVTAGVPVLTPEDTPDVPDEDVAAAEEGPVIINPDPDEEETLAAHQAEEPEIAPPEPPAEEPELAPKEAPAKEPGLVPMGQETADLGDLTIDDLTFGHHEDEEELEQIEFTTEVRRDSGKPESATPGASGGDDDDDTLSLLKSGYFTRTKGAGERGGIDDPDTESGHEAHDMPAQSADPTGAAERLTDAPESAPAQEEAGTREEPSPETATPARSDKSREQETRESASALFLAKQDSQRRRRRKLLPIAAAVVLIPAAGGVYWFYNEMTSTPQMGFNIASGGNQVENRFLGEDLPSPAADTAAPQATATGDTTGTAAPGTAVADTPASVQPGGESAGGSDTGETANESRPAPSATVADQQAGPQQVAQAAPATATPPAAAPGQQQPQQAAPANAAPAGNTTAQTGGNLNFVRKQVEAVVNPDLSAAYDSYQQGDLANAGRLYQQVLADEPTSRDAMLGLATVYLKQNNAPMAQNLYARLLELNPRDPLARAGLLDAIQGDPVRQEAELKSLINAYPGTAPLSFALGNLYASQNRWNEAQTAYFDALLAAKSTNAGPVSPDYAFNLAVSLEQLNQTQQARDYYREAAAYARNAVPGFDPALLQQRLNYLEQQLP